MHEKHRKRQEVKSNLEIAMEKAAAMSQEAPPGPATAAEARVREDELNALREKAAKADEYYDRLLRTAAELENYRKRAEREKSDLLKFGQEELMADLLPVLDNFERALAAAGSSPHPDAVAEGVKLIHKQLAAVLTQNGLQPIEAVGKQFDPELHEAIAQVETDKSPAGTILSEQLKGYALNGRLLRPAVVTVAVNKGAAEEAAAGDAGTDRGKAS